MADNYLDLDPHIQRNADALLTGAAEPNARFMVHTEGFKRMKRTRADGISIWDDVVGEVVEITHHVHNLAARLRREARS